MNTVSADNEFADLAPVSDRRSLAETVYQHLLAAIVGLKIRPGEIMNEVRLAEHLRVSVTPVREALLRLASDGLVIREAQKRPRVARFSLREVAELYDVRGALESFAAGQVATKATKADLERLSALQSDGRRSAQDGDHERYAAYNDTLHSTIMVLAENRLLLQTMQPIQLKIRQCMSITTMLPGQRFQGLSEHEEIVERLMARDPSGAAEAMRRHCEVAKQSCVDNYSKLENLPAPMPS